MNYRPVYVASYVAKKQVDKLKNELRKDGIEFLTFEKFIRRIVELIDKWKEDQVKRGFRKTKNITLPESWWLLNLIDSMKSAGLINI